MIWVFDVDGFSRMIKALLLEAKSFRKAKRRRRLPYSLVDPPEVCWRQEPPVILVPEGIRFRSSFQEQTT